MRKIKTAICYISATILLIATNNNLPYSYYKFLRIFISATLFFNVIYIFKYTDNKIIKEAHDSDINLIDSLIAWLFLLSTIYFFPAFGVHYSKFRWEIIDVATASLFIVFSSDFVVGKSSIQNNYSISTLKKSYTIYSLCLKPLQLICNIFNITLFISFILLGFNIINHFFIGIILQISLYLNILSNMIYKIQLNLTELLNKLKNENIKTIYKIDQRY